MQSRAGTFASDATGSPGATLDVVLGFGPKLVILWGSYESTGADVVGDTNFCLGLGDGTNMRCHCFADLWGAATTENKSQFSDDRILRFINPNTGATITYATIQFLGDRFRVTWPGGSSQASSINYWALGGNEFEVEVGHFNKVATLLTQSVATGVNGITAGQGFLFVASSFNQSTVFADDYCLDCGLTTGQGFVDEFGHSIGCTAEDGRASTRYRPMATEELLRQPIKGGGATAFRMAFDGFTPTGFDLSYITNDAATLAVIYAIVKGGHWESGFERAPSTISNPTFLHLLPATPQTIVLLNNNQTIDPWDIRSQSFAINASDGTNYASGGHSGINAAASTNTLTLQSDKFIFRNELPSSGDIIEATAVTFAVNTFDLNFSRVDDNTTPFFNYLLGTSTAPPVLEVPVAVAEEIDEGMTISAAKEPAALVVAEEVDEAFVVDRHKQASVVVAEEIDEGLAVSPQRVTDVVVAEEVDEAQVFGQAKQPPDVVVAEEIDEALTVSGGRGRVFASADEIDEAPAIGKVKETQPFAVAEEIDEAPDITAGYVVSVALAEEVNESLTIGGAKDVFFVLAQEIDEALAITLPDETPLAVADEVDEAFPFSSEKHKSFAVADEIDEATTITTQKALAFAVGVEIDEAFVFELQQDRFIAVADEIDEALIIGSQKIPPSYSLAEEIDEATTIGPQRAYDPSLAEEVDEAFVFTVQMGLAPVVSSGVIPRVWYATGGGQRYDDDSWQTRTVAIPVDLSPTIEAIVLPDDTIGDGGPTATEPINIVVGATVDILIPFNKRIGSLSLQRIGHLTKRGRSALVKGMVRQGKDAIIRVEVVEPGETLITCAAGVSNDQQRTIDLVVRGIPVEAIGGGFVAPPPPPPVPEWPIPPPVEP